VTGAPLDVSVVISTYNRATELADTLESLVAQAGMSGRYEVIVVDNNSTDGTRQEIEAWISRGYSGLRYAFEPRQGVSQGRNAGLRAARAGIVAFTDDDVIVAPDWLASIRRAFEENPGVAYVNGKILPLYAAPPPAWLTAANSGPCTIRDRGERPLFGEPGCFFPNWATANLAFRMRVFERVGPFAVDFDRGEDLELMVRVWRAGFAGMYAPDVVVSHKIPATRMTKAYHRMWHSREGGIRARIRYKEIFDQAGRVLAEPRSPTLFGASPLVYREWALQAGRWLMALVRDDEAHAFFCESQLRQTTRYVRTCHGQYASTSSVKTALHEAAGAVRALVRRRIRRKAKVV
jgi:GT2 family glycosyltransferase